MKELTIEQKAKAYNEAIEKARAFYKSTCLRNTLETLENIFPELKESEDERIRKAIIEFFESQDDNTTYSFVPKKDILAWLEKQGKSDETKAKIFLVNKGYPIDTNGTFPTYEEMYDIIREGLEKQYWQKPTLPIWKYKKDHTPLLRDSLILNKYGRVAKSPSGAMVSDVWVIDYDDLAKLPKEEIEKQGEQKPIKCNKEWYDFVRWFVKERTDNYTLIPSDTDIHTWGDIILDHAKKELEKQGEQNPYSGVSFKYDGHTWGMCARDNGVEILVDGEIKERVFLDNKPQGKTALETAKEEKIDNSNKAEPKDYNSIDPHFGKHIDKVEPKFKVGDKVYNIKNRFECIIESIDDTAYYCDTTNFDIKDQNNWELEKELKKIEPIENKDVELSNFESALFTAFSYAWQQYLRGEEVNVAQWAKEHSAELLEVARQEPAEWSEEDEAVLEVIKEAVMKYWGGYTQEDVILDWLKSIKERIGG